MSNDHQEALKHWRGRLRINKHRLDDELEVQAEAQEQIAARANQAEASEAQAKLDLQRTEARLIEDFRNEDRTTKDLAEAKAKRHPDYIAAWGRHQRARQEQREWSELLDAWKNKGRDLHAMGRLFGDQYFTLTSIYGPDRSAQRDSRSASERYERPITRRQRVPLE